LLGRARHDHAHLNASLAQAPDQIKALVSGNPATHDE
jgi:hypothetical protein